MTAYYGRAASRLAEIVPRPLLLLDFGNGVERISTLAFATIIGLYDAFVIRPDDAVGDLPGRRPSRFLCDEENRVAVCRERNFLDKLRIGSSRLQTWNNPAKVNVASIAGKEGNPNAGPYSVSKAGVIGLTKSLGKELASYDIAVNCVTPAAAKTAIFEQITQEHIDFMLSKIPRARFVKVEEVAALIAFCASPDLPFTTGAVFDISGGRATY